MRRTTLGHSTVTARGLISVPAEVRRRLGVEAGSLLEWAEDGEQVVVRRAGNATSEDVHRAAFPEGPPARRTLGALKEGVRRYARERHARR
jgi:AbrB family looped-hinge helix DNA binding protein